MKLKEHPQHTTAEDNGGNQEQLENENMTKDKYFAKIRV